MLTVTEAAGLSAADPAWRKASKSHDVGDCVEVALVGGRRVVRDSKTHAAGVLEFGAVEWRSFVGQIKRSEFDR